ncbi:cyclase family protein [Nocardia sp. CDC159]|uniref:Cyclase family protein n=1 Tax=Nocardia pulmonis TaxID=2951408 RepID=A0A9X2E2N8_9NOCA|nr:MULTISPECIES: cyclase family protein [Nocardia]MCM6772789.1 cyclase family protein [Nocardia pulmonis]MCM6785908.1 cyclase family protein [Nocardia sp. CDC159]
MNPPIARIVSLSHVHDPARTPLYPGDPAFELETVATVERDGYYLRYLRQGEHTGTHWGAPIHFDPEGLAADELEPEDLLLPAVKVDVREQCATDRDYAISVADLREWERVHGRIPDGAAVVAWTGWDAKWGGPEFAGVGECAGHQPGFAPEAVRWLLDSGRLGRRGALGIDTFGPDRGVDHSYAVSRLLYREHRISLECLANLAALPATGAWVLAGGPIYRAGSGGPAGVFAFIP